MSVVRSAENEDEKRKIQQENDAATKIQSVARKRAARAKVQEMKEKEAERKTELNDKDRQRLKLTLSYISSYRAICEENIAVAEQHDATQSKAAQSACEM